VEVGVADPGREHPHADLARSRLVEREVLDAERLARPLDHCRAHQLLRAVVTPTVTTQSL
jgi:hypothetical protein